MNEKRLEELAEEKMEKLIRRGIVSREYKIFKKEAKRKKNWYEKGCKLFGKLLKVRPTSSMKRSLQRAIGLSGLVTSPSEILSFVVLAPIFLFILTIFVYLLPILVSIKILIFSSPFVLGYYLYYYPYNQALKNRIEASNQSVIVTLYLAVYLRFRPNMEGAMRFAATRLEGPLSDDLKKLLWDVEMGKYSSVFDAISEYIPRWQMESKEFVEALRVLESSLAEPNEERRKAMLDRAMNIVLEGMISKMKTYSQELRLPTLVLHGIGITLPLITLVMFPMIGMFLTEAIRPEFLVLGYDIILPFTIYHLMRRFLIKRPGTVKLPDISEHPDVPKERRVRIGRYNFPLLYPTIAIFILASIPGFLNLDKILSIEAGAVGAIYSLSFIWAISLSLGFYFLLSSFQKVKIRNKVKSTEEEFGDALFQLGNKLAGGISFEAALEKTIRVLRGSGIVDLFRRILNNIKRLGMTLESAIFDKKFGAIRYYPQKRIRDVLRAVVDTAKKGVRFAALSMLTISRYMRDVKRVERNLTEILGETLSSMKFEAYILSPMVAATAVGMGVAMNQIFNVLSKKLAGTVPAPGAGTFSMFTLNFSRSIAPGILQMIVGVYLVEIVVLLSIFTNRIKYGYDAISRNNLIGKTLIITTFLYTIILIAIIIGFRTILPIGLI